nr:MAG TPA: hypothetical protein [Caudoviricetes sp.]DAT70400.1 MAG TPA: hypothetical protein [Caudoviricetes sp.]
MSFTCFPVVCLWHTSLFRRYRVFITMYFIASVF